jgi:hypothetical protein
VPGGAVVVLLLLDPTRPLLPVFALLGAAVVLVVLPVVLPRGGEHQPFRNAPFRGANNSWENPPLVGRNGWRLREAEAAMSWVKRWLVSPWRLAAIAAVVAGASVAASVISGDWQWFGRSGPIIALCGAALSVRRLLRLGPRQMAISESTMDGGEFGNAEAERRDQEDARQRYLDNCAAVVGLALLAAGTLIALIWGFGDLLGKVWGRV